MSVILYLKRKVKYKNDAESICFENHVILARGAKI